MTYLLKLDVFIEEEGRRMPFSLAIAHPEPTLDAEDYFCSVHAPVLFNGYKKIHGVDAEQSAELAIKFVKDLLSGRQLVDEAGNRVNF